MIVSISEMISTIEDFCKDVSIDSHTLTIGGCIGTALLSIAVTTVTEYTDISKVLVIEGCQDYIEIEKERILSHIFYGELFTQSFSAVSDITHEELKIDAVNILAEKLSGYNIIIINEAHIIDNVFLETIRGVYRGKILMIVDPYDIGGEKYIGSKTLTDSLSKVSMLRAYARKLIHVDSRYVDTSINSKVQDIGKINFKSIGKYDSNQWVTVDTDLMEKVNARYKKIQRLQKVMIIDDAIEHHFDDNHNNHVYMNHTLGTVVSIKLLSNRLYKFKMHNSSDIVHLDLVYNKTKRQQTKIVPANILSPENARFHKYNTTILVLPSGEPKSLGISPRQLYSVLRNTNNLKIGTYEKR